MRYSVEHSDPDPLAMLVNLSIWRMVYFVSRLKLGKRMAKTHNPSDKSG